MTCNACDASMRSRRCMPLPLPCDAMCNAGVLNVHKMYRPCAFHACNVCVCHVHKYAMCIIVVVSHVHTMCMTCHVYSLCMQSAFQGYSTCVLCAFHVNAMCTRGHVYAMGITCVLHVNALCMPCRCHVYDICNVRRCVQ